MYPLLEHEDFQKSRKALMATSAFVLLLHNFQIAGTVIEISGLKLNFDREVVVGFASLFLVYFTYVFVVRASEYFLTGRHQEILDLEKELSDRRAVHLEAFKKDPYGKSALEFEYHRARSTVILRFLRLLALFTVDLAPPLVFAFIAIIKAGSYSAMKAFLI